MKVIEWACYLIEAEAESSWESWTVVGHEFWSARALIDIHRCLAVSLRAIVDLKLAKLATYMHNWLCCSSAWPRRYKLYERMVLGACPIPSGAFQSESVGMHHNVTFTKHLTAFYQILVMPICHRWCWSSSNRIWCHLPGLLALRNINEVLTYWIFQSKCQVAFQIIPAQSIEKQR